jgi:hypothetical protein
MKQGAVLGFARGRGWVAMERMRIGRDGEMIDRSTENRP